jgi:uncharacterized membrane protein
MNHKVLKSRSLQIALLVTLIASILSLAKFNHCRSTNWASPDAYIHMCYSDISALYGVRQINIDKWPYASADDSLEYPVLTGVITYLTGLIIDDPNGYRAYFDLNAFLIVLLLFVSVFILWRLAPKYTPLFPIAPAVFGSLFINWDIWAVLFALLAIYFFQNRASLSALFLGIAISIKFYPGIILFAIILLLWSQRKQLALVKYLAITLISWLVINLPVALNSYEGWSRFFKLNLERDSDLGSIWYAANLLGFSGGNLNNLTIIAFLIALGAIGVFFFATAQSRSDLANLSSVAFLVLAAFVTISKVYSPQYILWLTPLAVLALSRDSQRFAFWVWQAGEAFYHFAIWQYLASYSGAKFGLSEDLYALAILLRIAALAYFVGALVKAGLEERSESLRNSQKNPLDFLPDSMYG